MADARSQESWVALLGQRDTPTDGVEDYCNFLALALKRQGVELELARVEWTERGWADALRRVREKGSAWKGRWVLVQYTALGWSRRGFPSRISGVIEALKEVGARVAIVFHEHSRQTESGRRWIDRVRGASQDSVIRTLHRNADLCVFTDPLEKIKWLPRSDAKSVFIPIGANIPEAIVSSKSERADGYGTKAVAIFGVTEYPTSEREREISDISRAVRAAAGKARVRVVFMGRGTAEAAAEIERGFRDIPAEISVLGLLSAEEIARQLKASDAMLFVRGRINSRRGSALAGVACGLPIVGYAGAVEGTPLNEAGVETVPYGDCDALGGALARVVAGDDLRRVLRERSEATQRAHFSWDAIARAFVLALKPMSQS